MSGLIDLDDLFPGSEPEINSEKENVEKESAKMNIEDLVSFRNHPFKLYEGTRLDDMVDSIKEHGIITPLIVRPLEDGKYEILSGHNRANAGKLAGLTVVPVVIKEGLSDEEAMLIVTETNLIQRSFSELSHSEKARILTERHKAIKNQGRRTDLINEIENMSNIDDLEENSNSRRICENFKSDVEIGRTYDLSPRNVSNYLRIDTLINELKKRLDVGEIPFTAGVDLSFLNMDNQETVELIIENYGYKVDLKKSEILKSLSRGRNFSHDKAMEVLSGEYFKKTKPKKKLKFTPKFTKDIISKYFDEDTSQKELEETVEKALEKYYRKIEAEASNPREASVL